MNYGRLLALLATTALAACGNEAEVKDVPASKPAQRVLNIYNWSDYIDPETVSDFAKANQIKVRYDVYDSNELLEAKVLTGQSGYDLVGPSDNFVPRQIKAGAYQKLNKEWLPNYHLINPILLTKLTAVDPGNEYVVPNYWGINTLAINVDKVKAALNGPLPENPWDLVFSKQYTEKLQRCGISYLDSPSEMFPLVLNYIGADPNSREQADYDQAAETMMAVRKHVKRFVSGGYIDDMASGNVCVAIGFGGDLNIAKNRAIESGNGVNVKVLVPKTGFGVWIDTFAIPRDAKNVAEAHAFINAMLDPTVAAKNADFVTYAPASLPARALMAPEYANDDSIFPSDQALDQGFVILPMAPETAKYTVRLWQRVKSGK